MDITDLHAVFLSSEVFNLSYFKSEKPQLIILLDSLFDKEIQFRVIGVYQNKTIYYATYFSFSELSDPKKARQLVEVFLRDASIHITDAIEKKRKDKITVTKSYVDTNVKNEITIEEAARSLEGRGHYKAGTIQEILVAAKEKPVTLRTPRAFYTFTNDHN